MFGGKKERVKLSKDSYKKATRFLKYVKPYQSMAYIGAFFLLASSFVSMIVPYLMGNLLGSFNINTATPTSSLLDADSFQFEGLSADQLIILIIAIFLAQAAFSFGRIYFVSRMTENALRDLRKDAFRNLVTAPIDFFNKNKVGELTSRIATDINALQETLNTTISELIRQVIMIIGMIAIISFISGSLAVKMLAVVPVVAIVAVVFGKFIRNLSKEAQNSAADSNTILEEALTGIINVKTFTNELFEIGRYQTAIDKIRALSLKSAVWKGLFVSFIILCMFGSIVYVIYSGVKMIPTGEISSQNFMSFIMCTVFLAASIGSLPDLYAKFQKAVGATEKLMDLLEEEGEAVADDKTPVQLKGQIQFDHVSFRYPQRQEIEVLKDINFQIEPGETVALVGSSGSGKSTIASLLLQLYPLENGTILFDGKPSKEYPIQGIRSNMAFVPQEVILFGGTIKENIAYGKLNATEGEIKAAAEQANALEFIESFPEKFDTIVGDRGIQLSGGQRQRIAIARAILKDPSILILDEATSALDTESEKKVQDALDKLMLNRTSVIIAHRLSTIKNANKILVMNHGEIVETGTHQELMTNVDGHYYQLNQNQFDRMVEA